MVRGLGPWGGPSCSATAAQTLTAPSPQEDDCPQFLNPSPLVIPVNHETDVTFQGKNLDTVQVGVLRARAWGQGLLWARPLQTLEPPWASVLRAQLVREGPGMMGGHLDGPRGFRV